MSIPIPPKLPKKIPLRLRPYLYFIPSPEDFAQARASIKPETKTKV